MPDAHARLIEVEVRTCTSDELQPEQVAAIRALLDRAFDGDVTDDDWHHALGGVHIVVDDGGDVVAHASVVPRTLRIGDRDVFVGYVEAVAVDPNRQRAGWGTYAMRAAGDIIGDRYELGALSTGEWHFYERLGWHRWRGPTAVRHLDGTYERTEDDDDGIMILRTATSPPIDARAAMTCDARAGDHW